MSVAGVLRDATGSLLDDFANQISTSLAIQAEATTVVTALRCLLQRRESTIQVEVETNCVIFVQGVRGEERALWEIDGRIWEARGLLACNLNVSLAYYNRNANQVAN